MTQRAEQCLQVLHAIDRGELLTLHCPLRAAGGGFDRGVSAALGAWLISPQPGHHQTDVWFCLAGFFTGVTNSREFKFYCPVASDRISQRSGGRPVLRVLIVDDTRLYREGLAYILSRQHDVQVVGTTDDSQESLRAACAVDADIILFHIAAPRGLVSLRAMAMAAPHAKLIALGVLETEDEVVACAEAGAAGYVPRDGSVEDLINAIHGAANGQAHCSPRIAATLLRRVAALAPSNTSGIAAAHLTPREREVVGLIDRGLSNKEIAKHLLIETRTVKNHVHNILEKLRVRRRGEAATLVRHARPGAFPASALETVPRD